MNFFGVNSEAISTPRLMSLGDSVNLLVSVSDTIKFQFFLWFGMVMVINQESHYNIGWMFGSLSFIERFVGNLRTEEPSCAFCMFVSTRAYFLKTCSSARYNNQSSWWSLHSWVNEILDSQCFFLTQVFSSNLYSLYTITSRIKAWRCRDSACYGI